MARLPEPGNQTGTPGFSRRGGRSPGEKRLKRRALPRKTSSREARVELRRLGTEKTNCASADLHRKTALEIPRIFSVDDATDFDCRRAIEIGRGEGCLIGAPAAECYSCFVA